MKVIIVQKLTLYHQKILLILWKNEVVEVLYAVTNRISYAWGYASNAL